MCCVLRAETACGRRLPAESALPAGRPHRGRVQGSVPAPGVHRVGVLPGAENFRTTGRHCRIDQAGDVSGFGVGVEVADLVHVHRDQNVRNRFDHALTPRTTPNPHEIHPPCASNFAPRRDVSNGAAVLNGGPIEAKS